jgi:hypothetical protein
MWAIPVHSVWSGSYLSHDAKRRVRDPNESRAAFDDYIHDRKEVGRLARPPLRTLCSRFSDGAQSAGWHHERTADGEIPLGVRSKFDQVAIAEMVIRENIGSWESPSLVDSRSDLKNPKKGEGGGRKGVRHVGFLE